MILTWRRTGHQIVTGVFPATIPITRFLGYRMGAVDVLFLAIGTYGSTFRTGYGRSSIGCQYR